MVNSILPDKGDILLTWQKTGLLSRLMKRSIKVVLAGAVIKILKPLIRVLMRHEVSYGEFAEMAKRAYVEVAYEHFSIPGRKMTYSRAAVLTGLNRKEIVRLMQQDIADMQAKKGTTNRAIRVITGWLTDSLFAGGNACLKELPLKGNGASFETLVAQYSGDITARAVLDELRRVGVVELSADKKTVKLVKEGYIPRNSESDQIDILSICVADLLETTVHNLESDDVRFQRQLIHKNVPRSTANEFKACSRDKSAELLHELNQWMIEKTAAEEDKAEPSVSRIGIGIYYFEDKGAYQKLRSKT